MLKRMKMRRNNERKKRKGEKENEVPGRENG